VRIKRFDRARACPPDDVLFDKQTKKPRDRRNDKKKPRYVSASFIIFALEVGEISSLLFEDNVGLFVDRTRTRFVFTTITTRREISITVRNVLFHLSPRARFFTPTIVYSLLPKRYVYRFRTRTRLKRNCCARRSTHVCLRGRKSNVAYVQTFFLVGDGIVITK